MHPSDPVTEAEVRLWHELAQKAREAREKADPDDDFCAASDEAADFEQAFAAIVRPVHVERLCAAWLDANTRKGSHGTK